MKEIIVDVDMVVADTFKACQDAVKRYGIVLKADRWNWFENLPPQETKILDKYLTDAKFWANLPLIPRAKEAIKYLRGQGNHITWVTAPYHRVFGWESARKQFLWNNFDVKPENVIFTDQKWRIWADVFIDDKYFFVKEWQKKWPNGQALLFDAPYNNKYKTIVWNDIIKGKIL